MFKIVYDLPNGKNFAFVSRSGSSSMGLMALKQFFPEKLVEYESDPNNINTGTSHRMLGGRLVDKLPNNCAVMVRNPVDRFASLLNRTRYDFESALELVYWMYSVGDPPSKNNRLIERSSLDAAYHFMPLYLIIENNTDVNLFKFPDLRGMANYLGIDENISCEHINKIPKPVSFNQSQLERIQKAYAKDIELYDNIVKSN
jgi:hypothetical protein